MEIRDRIWQELKQAHANVLCLQKYSHKIRWANIACSLVLLLISASGVICYKYFEFSPLISSMVFFVVYLFKLGKSIAMQGSGELSQIDGLYGFYSRYMNSMEKLWLENEKGKKNEDEISDEFFALKRKECEYTPRLNRYVRFITKGMQKEIIQESDIYLKSVFYGQNQ